MLQRYRHPRVLGIPIPQTLLIWVSPPHITLAIWVRLRVRVTGDAHITRVLGMGMPKTRGFPYHCDTGSCIRHFRTQGRVVQSWVKITQVSARFEFRFETLKSILVLILFVQKLMIGSSKSYRENYPRKCC